MKNRDILNDFDLNWTVEKQNLKLPNGKDTQFYGIVRKDTEDVLGIVRDRYNISQNYQILDGLQNIFKDTDFNIDKAGWFNKGSNVYFFVKEALELMIGGQEFTKHVFALSSHDGSCGNKFGFTIENKKENTFFNGGFFSIRHTKSGNMKIANIHKIFNQYFAIKNEVEGKFQIFHNQKCNRSIVKKIVNLLYNPEQIPFDKLSTRRKNKIKLLEYRIKSGMRKYGNTIWGMFQGVLMFTNKDLNKKNKQIEKVLTGNAYIMNKKVYDFLAFN